MAPLMTYALPTMQLVCHLMVPEPSNISTTTPGLIESSTTIPIPVLPSGYVAYPQFGAAYKVHKETVSWITANEKCIKEGARLAAMDSFEKIQAVQNQDPTARHKHVGFHLIESDTDWYNVNTGLPVQQSTLPWASGEPNGSGRCALIRSQDNGLGKYSCINDLHHFVCEISYP